MNPSIEIKYPNNSQYHNNIFSNKTILISSVDRNAPVELNRSLNQSFESPFKEHLTDIYKKTNQFRYEHVIDHEHDHDPKIEVIERKQTYYHNHNYDTIINKVDLSIKNEPPENVHKARRVITSRNSNRDKDANYYPKPAKTLTSANANSKQFNFEYTSSLNKKLKSKYLKTQYQPCFPICQGVGYRNLEYDHVMQFPLNQQNMSNSESTYIRKRLEKSKKYASILKMRNNNLNDSNVSPVNLKEDNKTFDITNFKSNQSYQKNNYNNKYISNILTSSKTKIQIVKCSKSKKKLIFNKITIGKSNLNDSKFNSKENMKSLNVNFSNENSLINLINNRTDNSINDKNENILSCDINYSSKPQIKVLKSIKISKKSLKKDSNSTNEN